MKQLITKWGKELNKDQILQEYPRPKLRRDSYMNLNGEWEFQICQLPEHIFEEDRSFSLDKILSGQVIRKDNILVPFSPEAYLSGANHILQPDELLIYRKIINLPQDFMKHHLFLNFEAVDQECIVFINRQEVGRHKGGYSAFTIDITKDYVKEKNEIIVLVKDQTEKSPHARGKQKLNPKGILKNIFYTPNSGIWKTVWLESTPEIYISELEIVPDLDSESIEVTVFVNQSTEQLVQITIEKENRILLQINVPTNKKTSIKIPEVEAWSPEKPIIYDVKASLCNDAIFSYFTMRKISYREDKDGILRFYLNNQPCFINGLLDQGYWPDSLLTPPSDEALITDIQNAKNLGFNALRKHIKVEAERFYYHCDRLGMLVIQDMPNGGDELKELIVSIIPTLSKKMRRTMRDKHYRRFSRTDEKGRKQYVEDLEAMLNQLKHYSCIIAWVPFNEGWGQFDANLATQFLFDNDSTRLVIQASGWYDQRGGDVYAIHNYFGKLKIKAQPDRVVALTEFGGYAYPIEKHIMFKESFGYKKYQDEHDLLKNYQELMERDVIANIKYGLSAAIYTQLSDVEKEVNGLYTYDRVLLKMDCEKIKEINQNIYQEFQKEALLIKDEEKRSEKQTGKTFKKKI